MNRDELKAEAEKLGMKVVDNFVDDWQENVAWVFIGGLIGYVVRWVTS